MAEFDDKLNALLSNPDAMSQIMQLANSLSGDSDTPSAPAAPEPPAPRSSGSVLSSLSGGTELLGKLLPLVQEMGRDSNARRLLYALRPYLKEERQEKIERALQLARCSRSGGSFYRNGRDEGCTTAIFAEKAAPTPGFRKKSAVPSPPPPGSTQSSRQEDTAGPAGRA